MVPRFTDWGIKQGKAAIRAMSAEATSSVGELFARYGEVVFRRCVQLLGNEDKAMDAVQEVFLRAFRGHRRFRGECSPMTWLYRIVYSFEIQPAARDSQQ